MWMAAQNDPLRSRAPLVTVAISDKLSELAWNSRSLTALTGDIKQGKGKAALFSLYNELYNEIVRLELQLVFHFIH